MKLWTWLEIHQFLSTCISSWIRFLRSYENVHRKATKNSDREEKSNSKSGTSCDKIIHKAIQSFKADHMLIFTGELLQSEARPTYGKRFQQFHLHRIQLLILVSSVNQLHLLRTLCHQQLGNMFSTLFLLKVQKHPLISKQYRHNNNQNLPDE